MAVTFAEKDGRTTLTWHTLFESVAMSAWTSSRARAADVGAGLVVAQPAVGTCLMMARPDNATSLPLDLVTSGGALRGW